MNESKINKLASLLNSSVTKPNVSPENQLKLAEKFFEIDKKVFNGRLFEYGVQLEFRPAIQTKLGLYTHATKVITIYNFSIVDSQMFTLAHEMVHAYDSMTHKDRCKHNHDQWFWFTLGQLCYAMGINVLPELIHIL